jgi:excisionase family DNA binding protein
MEGISTMRQPYTLKEAAKEVNVSYHTLWRQCRAGRLPHTRLGRKILIPAWVVDALLDGKSLTGERAVAQSDIIA